MEPVVSPTTQDGRQAEQNLQGLRTLTQPSQHVREEKAELRFAEPVLLGETTKELRQRRVVPSLVEGSGPLEQGVDLSP